MDDDNHNNIFDVLESESCSRKLIKDIGIPLAITSTRRNCLPLMNAGNSSYSLSTGDAQQVKRRSRELSDLDFRNPGPKNFVDVANVPSKRLKTRQLSSQDLLSTNKPLYDESGLLISDKTDRCDCNRLKCPGCFVSCSNCQSKKCGLECRKHRTYSYEYRLYGTNKEITQQ